MCLSFTPCYFAIIHIKYHIEMSPTGATCIPWNAFYIFKKNGSMAYMLADSNDIKLK